MTQSFAHPTGKKALGLVLKRLEVNVPTPAEIAQGCVLRRPTAAEIVVIKAALSRLAPEGFSILCTCFEMDPPPSGVGSYTRLDQEYWRYWLIEVPLQDFDFMPLYRVAEASYLCDVEIPCDAITFVADDAGKLELGAYRLLIPTHLNGPAKFLDEAALRQIQHVWKCLSDLRITGEHEPIAAAVRKYTSLASNLLMPPDPLYVFAILESILAHDPTGGYDSLTHQISTKMALLNKRLERPFDYSCFAPTEEATIWKKLYSYRSAIAHGTTPDFGNNLQVLKDSKTANEFLNNATKALLRHAFREPQLVLDLQRC